MLRRTENLIYHKCLFQVDFPFIQAIPNFKHRERIPIKNMWQLILEFTLPTSRILETRDLTLVKSTRACPCSSAEMTKEGQQDAPGLRAISGTN